MSTKVKFE